MEKIRHFFGEVNMTWVKVIIFAVIAGVYTGVINQVAVLENTSFRDIAISLEVWILFALLIVTNCKKPLEAALKCFVFFLISQPIVYLVEIPSLGYFPWGYYKYWFILTVLTLPGGAIAYYAKRKDIIGTIIISIANVGLVGIGMSYVNDLRTVFPNHLLSAIYCFAIAFSFILVLQSGKKERLIGIAAIVISAAVFAFIMFGGGGSIGAGAQGQLQLESNTTWECTLEDDSLGSVDVEGDQVTVTMNKEGSTILTCKGADGSEIIYDVTMGPDHIVNCIPEE